MGYKEMEEIIPGIYQHYKGKRYEVLGLARHSETLETMVVYRALYDDFGLWIRPAEMFVEHLTLNGERTPRFKYISEQNSEPVPKKSL